MGNLDSKLSPYYSIIDENKSDTSVLSKSSNEFNLSDLNKSNQSLWIVKKCNFNQENKNSLLFEFNQQKFSDSNSKKASQKHLKLALSHIKQLKTLRHPNIVKYYYSEEPQLGASPSSKCLLITEYLRPLNSVLRDLGNEELIRGIYGITNSVLFLHEKVSLSHNNINETCIFLNSKKTWKLSNFELALSFSDLNKANLKQIYEFKSQNAITPEEEDSEKGSNKFDLDLVYKKSPHAIDVYSWANLLINLIPKDLKKSYEILSNSNSTTNIVQELESQNQEYTFDYLENFLNLDPCKRPSLKLGLNLNIFDLCKDVNLNNNSLSLFSLFSNEYNFDPYRLESLTQLEQNYLDLIDYINNLLKKSILINEKLVDFLLQPKMFFSNNIKKYILPAVFIPNEETNSYLIKINKKAFFHSDKLEPFIDLDKYKAFVLPRILNLFSIHSLQIRLVLLEYFPFYAHLIDDKETLKYELLPELLLGLKDKNDELVSFTFISLSIMVKLLGSEIVVGKQNNSKKVNYFSDKIPKSLSISNSQSLTFSKISNSNSIEEDETVIHTNKIFSDSMIALHDDTDSVNRNIIQKSQEPEEDQQQQEVVEEDDQDGDFNNWNEFGWSSGGGGSLAEEKQSISTTNKQFNNESSASLVSLAGSLKISSKSQTRLPSFFNQSNDLIGSEYDIKTMNIKVNKASDPTNDLIENFLNEMKPDIKVKENRINQNEKHMKWECEEEINFDEI